MSYFHYSIQTLWSYLYILKAHPRNPLKKLFNAIFGAIFFVKELILINEHYVKHIKALTNLFLVGC